MVLKQKLKRFLLHIARCSIAAPFIGILFEYFSFLIPLKKIYSNKRVLVYKHPIPESRIHYLIVPRKSIRSFLKADLENEKIAEYLVNMFSAAHYVIQKLEKEFQSTLSIIMNGGKHQEVNQLHLHVILGAKSQESHYLTDNKKLESGKVVEKGKDYLFVESQNSKESEEYILFIKNIKKNLFQDLNFNKDQASVRKSLKIIKKFLIEKEIYDFSLIIDDLYLKFYGILSVRIIKRE